MCVDEFINLDQKKKWFIEQLNQYVLHIRSLCQRMYSSLEKIKELAMLRHYIFKVG